MLNATQHAHHHPIADHVGSRHQASSPSLAFQSSRTVWNGFQRFAIGISHHPTAYPGENVSRGIESACRFDCPRCCQTSQMTIVLR
jgi:hypothetical protein